MEMIYKSEQLRQQLWVSRCEGAPQTYDGFCILLAEHF